MPVEAISKVFAVVDKNFKPIRKFGDRESAEKFVEEHPSQGLFILEVYEG